MVEERPVINTWFYITVRGPPLPELIYILRDSFFVFPVFNSSCICCCWFVLYPFLSVANFISVFPFFIYSASQRQFQMYYITNTVVFYLRGENLRVKLKNIHLISNRFEIVDYTWRPFRAVQPS